MIDHVSIGVCFMPRHLGRADATTASRGCARTTDRTITPRSSSIRMAIGWKRIVAGRKTRRAGDASFFG